MTVTSAWVEQAQTFHQHLPHDHGVENFSCVLFAGFDNKVHESTCLVSPYRSADGMIYQYNPHVNEGDILVILVIYYIIQLRTEVQNQEQLLYLIYNLNHIYWNPRIW